jgi:5-azacytidine-induced protein 1
LILKENWFIQKEREMKDQLKRERDKEIEALINRLETEATLAREEADRTAENRIK